MAKRFFLAVCLVALAAPLVQASGADVALGAFRDTAHDGRAAVASGFVCPDRIGPYIRDAVGQSDAKGLAVFCSYYALDGIYGTVRIQPLTSGSDDPASLAGQFALERGTGAKRVAQTTRTYSSKYGRLSVFSRTYETSHLETLHYRVSYASAPIKGWMVQAVTEYASPRDDASKKLFLNWTYGPALAALEPHDASVPPAPVK